MWMYVIYVKMIHAYAFAEMHTCMHVQMCDVFVNGHDRVQLPGAVCSQSVAGVSACVHVYLGAHSQRVSAAALLPRGQASV